MKLTLITGDLSSILPKHNVLLFPERISYTVDGLHKYLQNMLYYNVCDDFTIVSNCIHVQYCLRMYFKDNLDKYSEFNIVNNLFNTTQKVDNYGRVERNEVPSWINYYLDQLS